MDADERKKIEAAMAQIARDKRAVEADPAAVMQSSIDGAMAEAKRRLRRLLLWAAIVATLIGVLLYLGGVHR